MNTEMKRDMSAHHLGHGESDQHSIGKDHSHTHSHAHGTAGADKAFALLQYTYNHNEAHIEELQELIDAYEKKGKTDIAEKLEASKALFAEANELLHQVLHEEAK